MALISHRFRKNIAARFSPGFGRSPNPGLPGALKGRGVSVKARLATWPRAWPICWWVVGGPAVKRRGEGRVSCTYTLCLADFECWVLSELVIDCVSGYVSALLKLAGGFCCWHGTLLEWSMPRACVVGQFASQGGGQRNSGRRHCLLVSAGMFLGIRSDIEGKWHLAGTLKDQVPLGLHV